MTIKIDKGIPIGDKGRPEKYRQYYDAIDTMEHGDSFEVRCMRTWDACRQYQYTKEFQSKNKGVRIITKRYTGNKYRIWKVFES